jgi:RNA 3'-terminal phosphate cyclase (ATP)
MIHVDGSQGEGGGQVLRTALALSMLTGQPVHLTRVRAGRRKPGLAPQHLAGVRAAAQLCGAHVEGAHLRSTDVTFQPGGPVQPGGHTFDISQLAETPSAGSVTLLLQTVLLPLALADGPSHLDLRGGTHVAWSPPAHYVEWVLLPTLALLGLHASMKLVTWGWYPEGGGRLEVDIQGNAQLVGADLTARGETTELQGVAAVSNLPSHIPHRIASRANNLLRDAGLPQQVQPLRTRGPSTGAGIFMALAHQNGVRAGFSALGVKGKPSEAVAEEATDDLLAYYAQHTQDGALDRYLPDQLLPVLALAAGPSLISTVEITRHTLTNVAVVRRFVQREIVVEGQEGQPGRIRVQGSAPGYR